MNIEKTIMELEKHHMQVYFVANAAEAKEKVLSLIPAGATVANGGSMTLVDSGIIDAVKSGEYRYLDRNMQGLSEDEKNMRLGEIMTCDYFLKCDNGKRRALQCGRHIKPRERFALRTEECDNRGRNKQDCSRP